MSDEPHDRLTAQELLGRALADARELANTSSPVDWGHVSDVGCDIVFALERLRRLLGTYDGD